MKRRVFAARAWQCVAALLLILGFNLQIRAHSTVVLQQNGQDVVLPVAPSRVISLSVGAIDALDVLGISVQGVPVLAQWPAHLKRYESEQYLKVGSLSTPNPQVIEAALPQVIFVGGRSDDSAETLSGIAPTLDFTVDLRRLVDNVVGHARMLGRLFGREALAEQRIETLKSSIAAVREQAPSAGAGLVLIVTANRIYAQGPAHRFGLFYEVLGLPAASMDFDGQGKRGVLMTPEEIGRLDPAWIFVIDRDQALGMPDASPASHVLDEPAVRQTRAARTGRLVHLDGFDNYVVNNTSIGALQRTVDAVARMLRR